MRHYNTKARREERAKWGWLTVFSIIGFLVILIGYCGAITPTMAEAYDLTSYNPVKATKLKQAELTTREHICSATNGENCDVIYNLCMKESNCQKYAVNKNSNGTFDYSYLQINDVHIIGRSASKGRGTITMDCVYDLYCVSRWANAKIKDGAGHIWVAWNGI